MGKLAIIAVQEYGYLGFNVPFKGFLLVLFLLSSNPVDNLLDNQKKVSDYQSFTQRGFSFHKQMKV